MKLPAARKKSPPAPRRRRRKPMSEEQRAAAAERLRIAREKRGADGSKSVHPDLRDLPEDHYLHWKKVKAWIKSNSDELKRIRKWKNSKVRKERAEYTDLSTYVENMKRYLSTGVWMDFRYGEDRDKKIKWKCWRMARHDDGTPKRTEGVWYPDIGTTWKKEHDYDEENN